MNLTTEVERLNKSVKRLKAELKDAKEEIAQRGIEIMELQKNFRAWRNQLPSVYCENLDIIFRNFNERNEETDTARRRK
jgi:hypothetical protein